MAYSGTTGQTTFNTRRVIDSAVRRCKIPAQQITAETIDIAKDELFLMLSAWANDQAPLHTVEKKIYPLYEGNYSVPLGVGTFDVLDVNLRTLFEASGTVATASTTHTTAFGAATAVEVVGVKWNGAATNLTFERSDDGATWTTIQTETPAEGSGEWSWFDISPVISASYFRVTGAATLNYSEIFLGNTPQEIPLARLNREQYTSLPAKTTKSARPLQYWFDREANQPQMRLWPVPNATTEHYQLVAWRHRHIMDVGTLAQEIEVPQQWYDAVVAGLAARLALELPEADPAMVPILDQKAALALSRAQQGDFDSAPVYIRGNIGAYTA